MTKVYLLQNQDGYFLNNQQEWVDGGDAKRIYRTVHKDEALNTKAEITVKFADIRIEIITCGTNDKGIPQIPDSLLPDLSPTLDIETEPASHAQQNDSLQAYESNTQDMPTGDTLGSEIKQSANDISPQLATPLPEEDNP